MDTYISLSARFNKLQNILPQKYFEISEEPTFNCEKHIRTSIYNLEQYIELVSKVIIVQSCAKRWLARIEVYKIKNNIKNDKELNKLVGKMMKLKKCDTITALAILNNT